MIIILCSLKKINEYVVNIIFSKLEVRETMKCQNDGF